MEAARHAHVLVDDRPPDHGARLDDHVVEQDGILDQRAVVDVHTGRQDGRGRSSGAKRSRALCVLPAVANDVRSARTFRQAPAFEFELAVPRDRYLRLAFQIERWWRWRVPGDQSAFPESPD